MQHPYIVIEALHITAVSRDTNKMRDSAEDFQPGDMLYLTYTITSYENSAFAAWLGASLVNEKGEEYAEVSQDKNVQLAPGRQDYQRILSVPLSWAAKKTTLHVAVYEGKAEDRTLKRIAGLTKDLTRPH
jgi:hypothetical protein